MSKSKQDKVSDNVESAICSLYQAFPRFSGCNRVRTQEVAAIEKKIKQREEELAKDAKLAKLREQLTDTKKATMKRSNDLHSQVDKLRNRFRLRGVTEELISDIEKMSELEPIVECHDCE